MATEVGKRVDARIQEMRERNQLIQSIKAQMWGKDLSEQQQRAVAHYCTVNGLDAVRHVEVLGGRIYLTAEFYRERGAPLIRSGAVRRAETTYIHVDPRLDTDAESTDDMVKEWAKIESFHRRQLRVRWAVPEDTIGAAIVSLFVRGEQTPIVGVNWINAPGGKKRDPVGEQEPTKTAETRAERRAWRQLADVIPDYGAIVRPIEAAAKVASEEIIAEIAEPEPPRPMLTGRSAEVVNEVVRGREATFATAGDDDDIRLELKRQDSED